MHCCIPFLIVNRKDKLPLEKKAFAASSWNWYSEHCGNYVLSWRNCSSLDRTLQVFLKKHWNRTSTTSTSFYFAGRCGVLYSCTRMVMFFQCALSCLMYEKTFSKLSTVTVPFLWKGNRKRQEGERNNFHYDKCTTEGDWRAFRVLSLFSRLWQLKPSYKVSQTIIFARRKNEHNVNIWKCKYPK